MASIYRGTKSYKTIYGYAVSTPCSTETACLTNELITRFFGVVDNIRTVVEKLFPAITATSNVITNITAYAFMNDYTRVRFMWIKRHPGMIFDHNNMSLRYQLLDIYLEYGLTSWVTDTQVNTLIKTS